MPPRTHNLIDLAQRAQLEPTQDHREFIGKINDASVVTRYPEDLAKAIAEYPEAVAREYLDGTKEVIVWLRQDPRLDTP